MSSKKLFKKGAEAELVINTSKQVSTLSKTRISKSYRHKKLDASIRQTRTRAEVKLLKEASREVNVPRIVEVNEESCEIVMEFIPGKRLKDVLEKTPALAKEAGEKIKKIHNMGLIHGDLTTSNILFVDSDESKNDSEMLKRIKSKGRLFFIDFGLGYYSKKVEDKATDLVVFKKTFNATHSGIKDGWKKVMQGYKPDAELKERMGQIEKRARYH
jgi:Kae1-associated kinase Bud32